MLFSLLSGILTGLTFVFNDICYLNLISLVPLIYVISKGEKSFLKGFLYGISLNTVSMSFFFTMHPLEFMGLSGFKSFGLVMAMYLGVILVEGLFAGVFIYLFNKFIKNIWVFPLCYAMFEFLISLGDTGLTFSHLYLPYFENIRFIQSAGILSSYFLTLIIIYINVFIFKAIISRKYIYCFIAFAIFSGNIAYGTVKINTYSYDNLQYDIALIQGNISSNEKWENNSVRRNIEIYKELTLNAKKEYGVNLAVWPETVVTYILTPDSFMYKEISEFAKENEMDIVFGTFFDGEDCYYNSVLGFNKSGKQYENVYHKRHLIPLAEKTYSKDDKLKEGRDAVVINTDSGRIGGLVCIDSAYPHLAYKTSGYNPDYLLVVSNDSWFRDSFGVRNHLAHSVMRAVENNKYVLRCANTGITAVISPTGEIKGEIEPLRRGYTVIKNGVITSEKE